RTQTVDSLLGQEALVVILRCLELSLRIGKLCRDDASRRRSLGIERSLCQHSQPIGFNLGETALDEDTARLARQLNVKHARSEHRQHWRVVRQNSEIALYPRQYDLLRVLRQEHALRAYQLELERVSHIPSSG